MEDSEELVNKVLASLREAEIPAGLETRILNTVRVRIQSPEASGWRRHLHLWAPASLRSVAAATVVCATIVVALIGVSLHPRHAELPAKRIDAGSQAQQSDHPGIPSHLTSPMQSAPRALRAQLPRSRTLSPKQAIEKVVLAANQPAPPLPLTSQEKLLIEVARQRNRAALLLLSQDAQNEQLARADQQFQKFFAPPPATPTPQQNKDATDGPGGSL